MAKKKTIKKALTKKATTKKKVTRKKPDTGQAEHGFGAPSPSGTASGATPGTTSGATSGTTSGATSGTTSGATSGPPRTKTTAQAKERTTFSPVARRIRSESKIICQKILLGQKPSMKFPLRSLANVTYSSATGYFKLKGKKKERTLTVNTVKTFAQTLKMMSLSKELIDTDDIATKREAYYVSKNWEDARFKE